MTICSSSLATATGAAGEAVTLLLPAPPAGLRHYLAGLTIDRFAASALAANAAPTIVTTTNLPGNAAFSIAAEAAAQGSVARHRESFPLPLAAISQATATSIECPATTGVIWRATASFFVAP